MRLLPDNPFAIAKVFLNHRCDHHRHARFLTTALERSGVPVWYSCRGDMKFGDPVLPRKELARSDFVLVLASPGTFEGPTVAAAEFSIAEILGVRKSLGIGIVALESVAIPTELSAFSFQRFRWKSRNADARRIVTAVKDRLQRDLGLLARATTDGNKLFVAGSDLEPVLNYLRRGAAGRLPLPLNAPMRHYEMTAAVEIVRAWPRKEREKAIALLQKVYGSSGPEAEAARQNAVFMLGKLASNDAAVLDDLRHLYPNHTEPFLYRGYHVAHAYGKNSDVMAQYSRQLESETGREWRQQKAVNRAFHLLYYGGLPGTLFELRTTLQEGRPRSLLHLNTFTLGELSSAPADARLLSDLRGQLQHLGVPKNTIDTASKRIAGRSGRK